MNILLLRGLVREQRYWGRFVGLLQDAGHNVLCIDLPGLGENRDKEFPLTIREAYLEIRKEFIEKKKEGPYSIMAISLGGMIALEWVHHMPSDFEKLYLINTSALNVGLPWERLLPRAMKQCVEISLENDIEKREELILKMTTNFGYKNPAVVAQWIGIAKTSPYTPMTAARQLAAASRYLAPEKLIIPTLILASENDKMVSVKCSCRLAKRLKAEIHIHPNAGHDIAVDDPEWLVKQISG